jgi:hypothetical protein
MTVPEQHGQRLAELAAVTPCERDHACLKSAPEKLCGAKLAGNGRTILCLDEDGWRCRYGISIGQNLACTCLVRQYIAKHLSRMETGA